ncbi:MAG TPA: 2-dehydropantoate 2-reductase N-terminal domain-containing protein, partial [Negativicutes bacterium]
MREIKKVAIVGLGAIGGIYALKIHEFDPQCLQVILDQGRYEKYVEDGIAINGKRYAFNYVLPGSNTEKVDLIFIATKSNGLQEAIEIIEGFVGPDTIIISLLNGISSETTISEKFGRDKILYSLFIGHISTKVDNAVTHDGVGTIVFGEADNTVISEKTAAVRDFFDKAGIDYKIPPDMF